MKMWWSPYIHFFVLFLMMIISSSVGQSNCPLIGYDGYVGQINMVSHQVRGAIQVREQDCSFVVRKFDVVGFEGMTWWAATALDLDAILNGQPLSTNSSFSMDLVNATQIVSIPENSWSELQSIKVLALWIPFEARLVGYVELGSKARAPSMFDHCLKYAENAQFRWNIVIDFQAPELSYAEFAYEGNIAEEQYHSIGFPLAKDNIMGGADSITYGLIDGQPFAMDFFFPNYQPCKEVSPGKYSGVCSDLQLGQGKDIYDNVNLTYSQQVEGTWLITAKRLLNSTDRRFDLDINPYHPMYLLWAVAGFTLSDQKIPMLNYHGQAHGMKNVTLIDGTVDSEASACELIYDPLAISTGSTYLIQDFSEALTITLGAKTSVNPLQPNQVIYINGQPTPTLIVKKEDQVTFNIQNQDIDLIITDSPIGGSYVEAENIYAQGDRKVTWSAVDLPSNITQVYYQSLLNPLIGGSILIDHSDDLQEDNIYDFTATWDALNVEWVLEGEGDNRLMSWTVEATKPTEWICIGFGSLMKGGYAYVGWLDDSGEGQILGYHMTGQAVSDVHLDTNAEILNAVVERNGITKRLKMSFQRYFTTQSELEPNIQSDGQVDMIWAYGESWTASDLSHKNIHSARGIEIVNLVSGETKSKPVAAIWIAHGVLMFVGWSFLVPFAVIVARYFKAELGPTWMMVHKYCNIFGLVVSVVGAALAIYEMQIAGAEHFSTQHTMMGLIVVLLGVCQGVQGFIRPAKPGPDSKRIDHIKRNIWCIPHKLIGISLLIVAHLAVISGLQALELKGAQDMFKWHIAVYAWIVTIILIVIILQIRAFIKNKYQEQATKETHASSDTDSVGKDNSDKKVTERVDVELERGSIESSEQE